MKIEQRRRVGQGRRISFEPLEDRQLLTAIIALSDDGRLLRLDSEAPDVIVGQATVSGLQAGETLLGIDTRPATGELYGLGSAGRLYTINPTSGAATFRAALTADPTDTTDPFTSLSGTNFGIDFNPVPDRLRVVSDADINLRINPDTGAVTTDTPLTFATGDANAGANPAVVDVAYTNSIAGATSTTLYGFDASGRFLRQGGVGVPPGTPSPNTGQLTTLNNTTGATITGFDVAPGGVAFVATTTTGVGTTTSNGVSVLNTVDLATGATTSLGTIGLGSLTLRDLAVLGPSVRTTASLVATREGAGSATITVTLADGPSATPVTVPFSTANGSALAGADYGSTAGTLTFNPGETTKSIVVPIVDDATAEPDETFAVVLGAPTGAVAGSSVVIVRISANDFRDRRGPILINASRTSGSGTSTGVVLQFDEDLDPTRATSLANYELRAFTSRRRSTRIAITSATYDAATRSVTLLVTPPAVFARLQLTVRSGRRGITDVSGNRLDGNGDGRGGDNLVLSS